MAKAVLALLPVSGEEWFHRGLGGCVQVNAVTQ